MQLAKPHLLVRISKLPNNALSFPTHQFLEMVLLQMTVQQKNVIEVTRLTEHIRIYQQDASEQSKH